MTSTKNVQNTHIDTRLRQLHVAMLEIVGAMNRPQNDEILVREAGIALDRALFPLLVVIERFGPIGVVELAERAGRDHTTISRQVARLKALGLVERRASPTDRRVRQAVVTAKGKAMTDRLDAARNRLSRMILSTWEEKDIDDLVRLMGKFADTIKAAPDR
jgi:DNA-binding MarR family transcriptional regulator